MSKRTDEVWEEIIRQNGLEPNSSAEKEFIKKLVEHVYEVACKDCMVMLEDCSGYNLRDTVK